MSNDTLDVFWHPDCFKHNTGEGCYEFDASPLMAITEPHPENAVRLLNIKSILEKGPLAPQLNWYQAEHADRAAIEHFCDSRYLDSIYAAQQAADESGELIRLDGGGTVVNQGTLPALLASAGCGLNALNAILSGQTRRAYCLVRPPGHHASRHLADGYCMINNIGVVAENARRHGIERIAVIDWDVHHGNGTQAGFYDRDDVFTISMHMPLGAWGENHPETGATDEAGVGAGLGYNLNIPLPYGSGDQAYQAAMEQLIRPALDDFQPQLLLIACGLDANQLDLNGRNLLSMAGFRAMGKIAREIADQHCDGKLLLMQEGGYAITYTGFCMYAVLEGILKVSDPIEDPLAYGPEIEQPEHAFTQLTETKKTWEALTGKRLPT